MRNVLLDGSDFYRGRSLIAEKGVLLADGATGTNFFNMGLVSGDAPELWNETAPEKVKLLHQGFVDAGADIILTNTFGGNAHRLKLHDAQDQARELNRKAALLAREVADAAGKTGRVNQRPPVPLRQQGGFAGVGVVDPG